MKQILLTPDQVLAGYDAMQPLYPYIPPMNMWRPWEYAAYQRYHLPEPVLDVGCGDGAFFKLLWPGIKNATGIDADASTGEQARQSGIYREVHVAYAHESPVARKHFNAVFSNCALEHMDHLDGVLKAVFDSLRPGGVFLSSVVTNRFVEWSTLRDLVKGIGLPDQARLLQRGYEDYHHLVNPLAVEAWVAHFEQAGFEVIEHVPILPDVASRGFLFLDALWHVPGPGGEIGGYLERYFSQCRHFPDAFRHVLKGLLLMDNNWTEGSGAVFWARKP